MPCLILVLVQVLLMEVGMELSLHDFGIFLAYIFHPYHIVCHAGILYGYGNG